MDKHYVYNQELLHRIANHLIINSSFLDNLGLFHGKMGIVIFFYHYSRYLNNPIYEEFAGELLDEIFEEIHDQLPLDFENGYLGIGWGIEYLADQKFICGDTNEILEDIDEKVMERDVTRILDASVNTGLGGIFHYVLSRLRDKRGHNAIFDRQYFSDLLYVADKIEGQQSNESISMVINLFKQWHRTNELIYNHSTLLEDLCLTTIQNNDNVFEWKLGLNGGCAGMGIKSITI